MHDTYKQDYLAQAERHTASGIDRFDELIDEARARAPTCCSRSTPAPPRSSATPRSMVPGSGPWLTALLGRRPAKVAAIALANKIARMAWGQPGAVMRLLEYSNASNKQVSGRRLGANAIR